MKWGWRYATRLSRDSPHALKGQQRRTHSSLPTHMHPNLFDGIVLCADFDQTVTERDTIHLLFDQAYENLPCSAARHAHKAEVSRLIAQYQDELKSYDAQWLQNREVNHSPRRSEQFDARELAKYLDGYAEVDMRSIERVTRSGVLKGIYLAQLIQLGARIEFRDLSVDVLFRQEYCSEGFILSSNWSAQMVIAALRHSCEVQIPSTSVIANELEFERSTSTSTGRIDPLRVQSARDKATELRRFRTAFPRKLIVFVGDSVNDLLALVEADVGIVISDREGSPSRSFELIAQASGLMLEPVEGKGIKHLAFRSAEMRKINHHAVYVARNWTEIHEMLSTE